jgi:hypothetical protein
MLFGRASGTDATKGAPDAKYFLGRFILKYLFKKN